MVHLGVGEMVASNDFIFIREHYEQGINFINIRERNEQDISLFNWSGDHVATIERPSFSIDSCHSIEAIGVHSDILILIIDKSYIVTYKIN